MDCVGYWLYMFNDAVIYIYVEQKVEIIYGMMRNVMIESGKIRRIDVIYVVIDARFPMH